MGADRRGPLAAFILVAVVAAILLVTSVRSQARPGWLDPARIPTVAVAAPPAVEPDVWHTVTDELGMVVQQGVLLVHKATAVPVQTTDPTVTEAVATQDPTEVVPAVQATSHRVRHRHDAAKPRHRAITSPDRGGRTTTVSTARPGAHASADAVTHGKGHAYGRGQSHGHSAHGHGHGHAWGRGHH